jgi:hypothetical protein
MLVLSLAVLLQVGPPLRVVGLRSETSGAQQKLIVEATGDWGPIPITREGHEIIASLPAEMTRRLDPPPAVPPLESIRVVRQAGIVQIRVAVKATVPFEVQRNGRQLILSFGEARTPEGISPDLLAAYESLRPPAGVAPAETFDEPTSLETQDGDDRPGLRLGPLSFRPALLLTYVQSDTSVETPLPLRDSYFQVEPRLGAHLSLWDGRIRATYEPQIRMQSDFERINRTSHDLDARADIPIGTRVLLRGTQRYAISTLDTEQVDPGREYFFRLGRFRRSETTAGVQIGVGPRLSAVFGAGYNRIEFEEETSFFDYERRRATGGFEFMLTESLRTRLAYEYEEVPPAPERSLVESTAQSVSMSLSGEFMPLTSGELGIAYRHQEAPQAGEGGRRYDGVTARIAFVKELSRGTRLTLAGNRSIHVSSFEQNAFYVTTNVRLTLDAALPLGLSGRAGGGYHWNAYRTEAIGLNEKREDRLYGWTAGLSRPLNRWSYLRADYAWDRRESNVPAFTNESTTFLVQLGIGMFDSSAP